MPPRPRRDPEPVEIELVPIGCARTESGTRDRPPTAGLGTVPSAASVLSVLVARALDTPDPPLVSTAGAGSWPDLRVHRLIRLAPDDAARGLRAALATSGGRIDAAAPGRRGRRGRRRATSAAGSLVVVGRTRRSAVAAALHVHRHGRPIPVEITLEPWSARRTDLCLAVRRRPGRTGLHLPRRYFDVAHRVMDELWHQIEADAAA